MAHAGVTLFAALLAGLAVAGCGGEPEFAPQPAPPEAGALAPAPPQPPAVATGAPPQDAGAPPTMQPCDATMTLAISSMFEARRKADAPGMEPEGSPLCGVVAEGQQVATQLFVLQPGYCYSFLGQGLPNVTEVDMQLVLDPTGGALPPALAAFNPLLLQDTLTGPVTSMATKKDCYKWALPVGAPVKLTVKARAGAGAVAGQVYKKRAIP